MIAGFRCAGTGRLVKAGVSMTHMHVMWLLQHHGDLHMGQLAEFLDVSMSNATGIVDRMEERGLVERVRVPDDRRVVQVRPAPAGLQALEPSSPRSRIDSGTSCAASRRRSTHPRLAGARATLRTAVADEIGPDFASTLRRPGELTHPSQSTGRN